MSQFHIRTGARIRAIRERQGIPQQHVQIVMRYRYGHSWHQTTMSKTESQSFLDHRVAELT